MSYIKITFDDISTAEDYFESNKDFGEFLRCVCSYYRTGNFETNNKSVQKYLKVYKKTMDFVIQSRESGKNGGLKRIENQQLESQTLQGYYKGTTTVLEPPVQPNNKLINNNKINNRISIVERKQAFRSELEPFLKDYGKDTLNDFYLYWTEENKSKTKMKFELETTWNTSLRLTTWVKRSAKFEQKKLTQPQTEQPQIYTKSSNYAYK